MDDFRAGFIDYMTHFSDELARRIDAAESTARAETPHAEDDPPPTEIREIE